MGLLNHVPNYGAGLKFHRGSHIQTGHGLGSMFASLFKAGMKALPGIARKAGTVASKVANSKLGQNLQDVVVDGVTNAAVNAISGEDPLKDVGQSVDDARTKIIDALKENRDKRKFNNDASAPTGSKAKRRKKGKRASVVHQSKRRKKNFDLLEDSSSE